LYDGDARFPTRLAARTAIFEFIEVFSNRRRLHSSIDYVSLDVFEKEVPTGSGGINGCLARSCPRKRVKTR